MDDIRETKIPYLNMAEQEHHKIVVAIVVSFTYESAAYHTT